MTGPDPVTRYPLADHPRVRFIAPELTDERITAGAYSYHDEPDRSATFEQRLLYHFPWDQDRLIIGRFCAIAMGVKFIMNGGNHATDGFSTYPFFIFGNGWEDAIPTSFPDKGDTHLGHDVWVGYDALIMPGARIGHGAIIAARAVVTGEIPPYVIAGGNPARVIRPRFAPEVVAELLAIAWWDWEVAKVTRHLSAIIGHDLAALRAAR